MSDGPDEVMVRMGQALELAQQGDRPGARSRFEALWAEVGPDGDPFHRVAIAHQLADVQDDPLEELAWDERALAAAELLTDERVAAGGVATGAASLYPSLHLNLADVLLRLGRPDRAAHHVAAGRAALGALPDDGYRQLIVGGLDRVEAALATG